MKFNFRVKDLEVRSCGKHLFSDGEHNTAEIVKWVNDEKPYCLTIAYWERGEYGYDLQFVGDRQFDVDNKLFMRLAKFGQQKLDIKYNKT